MLKERRDFYEGIVPQKQKKYDGKIEKMLTAKKHSFFYTRTLIKFYQAFQYEREKSLTLLVVKHEKKMKSLREVLGIKLLPAFL